MPAPDRVPHTRQTPGPPDANTPAGQNQLGFLFEEPAEKRQLAAPQPTPPAPLAPAKRARSAPDTLPAWARAAMPLPKAPEPSEGDVDETPSRRVWRVADLVSEVRDHIEGAYPDLWVRGEISNLRAAPSGHMYFTLKDGEAQLPAVLFRKQAQTLRFRPEDGLEILLRGRVSVYEQRGQMQLIAEYMEPVGAGSLQVAFEQLKKRLDAEGLFAIDRKRTLPAYPHCVGIVTSPSGAVIRDFLNVANRRHAALDVLLYPATVQGEAAAGEIAAGIAWFNRARNVDVIVIARGGGSLEDLAPFNSERVARAIAASTLPVVSAVGHETDFTIADFVADLRAPTPSAAAELITAAQHRIEEHIDSLQQRLERATRYMVALAHKRLGAQSIATSFARLRDSLGRREQRLDEQSFRLERAQRAALGRASDALRSLTAALMQQDASYRLRVMRERSAGLALRLERAGASLVAVSLARHAAVADRLTRYQPTQSLLRVQRHQDTLHQRLCRAVAAQLREAQQHEVRVTGALNSLSPMAVLARGYALVFTDAGTLVTRAEATERGEQVHVQLAHGAVRATITARDSDI